MSRNDVAALRAENLRLAEERDAAIREMSEYARQLGEMQGRYEAAHWPGVIDDWRQTVAAATALLKPFADTPIPGGAKDHWPINYTPLLATYGDVRKARAFLKDHPP